MPMESSPSSAPSGVSGGGLQQMAAGLTRRLSSNIGAAIRGSPPSKPSTSPGRELYRVNVNPGGLGLGLQSGVSPVRVVPAEARRDGDQQPDDEVLASGCFRRTRWTPTGARGRRQRKLRSVFQSLQREVRDVDSYQRRVPPVANRYLRNRRRRRRRRRRSRSREWRRTRRRRRRGRNSSRLFRSASPSSNAPPPCYGRRHGAVG